MVSAAHLCGGPRIGYRAGNPDVMVGAMTSAVTPLLATVSHHPTWRNFQWTKWSHRLVSLPNLVKIRVRVRPKDDTTKKLIEAVGTLSNDGKSFSVVVTREDGAQLTHD